MEGCENMMKIIGMYILISILLYLKNKYRHLRCNYIINTMYDNKNNTDNYKYILAIEILLDKADIYHLNVPKDLQDYPDTIIDALQIARGIYIGRCYRALLWGYFFLMEIHIFKPIFSRTNNKLIALIFCLVEFFVTYLLGLYLDTTDIGSKILAFLPAALNKLVDALLAFLH